MRGSWLIGLTAWLVAASPAAPPPAPEPEAYLDCSLGGGRCLLVVGPVEATLAEAAAAAQAQREPTLAGAAALAALPPPEASEPLIPAPRPSKAAVSPRKLQAFADASGAVRIVVSLKRQRAYVFQGGKLVASAPVSTGKAGHATPVGTFPILGKAVHHRSNKYANAPMPYMQRLTASGVALHAGHLPGYPASHGCIRLPWGFAKKLYNMTGPGTVVTVTREAPRAAAG